MRRRDLLTALPLLLVPLRARAEGCTHPIWIDDGWYSEAISKTCTRKVHKYKCLSCDAEKVVAVKYEGDCGGCS